MITKSREIAGEQETLAFQIIDECDRLIGMINTMLDISETEAGTEKLRREDVDMADIARDAADLFLPIAEEKNITLITDLIYEAPVSGDLKKLQRMAANLLDNAIKYTPSGGEIRMSIEKNEDMIVFSIHDNGIGIEPSDITRIFDRYYQCDNSRSSGGVGLGLSLARAIARAHGGDIAVNSTPGKETLFTVTLPGYRPSDADSPAHTKMTN